MLNFFLVINLFLLSHCSTGSERKIHNHKKIIAKPVFIRRPHYASADENAGPKGLDSVSSPLPGINFDCEPAKNLYKDHDKKAIVKCFNSIREVQRLSFLLVRDTQPYLAMKPNKTASKCLKEVFERIPVPREIFFRATHPHRKDQLACYNSKLDLEKNRLLGARTPEGKLSLHLTFPIDHIEDDVQLLQHLVSWSLTPLFHEEGEEELIDTRIVPDNICKRCFSDKDLKNKNIPTIPGWP